MRPGPSTLAVCAVAVLVGCSGPEAPRERAVPDEGMPPPAPPPVTVHVQVSEGAGEGAEAWAEALRAAITAGHGALILAAAEDARVVVRIDEVETGVEVENPPPGEGDISVMRGALLVGESAREFTYVDRGEARVQAERLARNLRGLTAEGADEAPAPEEAEADDES